MAKDIKPKNEELEEEELEYEEEIIHESPREKVSAESFIEKNKNTFLFGIVIVAVVIVGYFMFFRVGPEQEAAAQNELYPSLYLFQQDSLNQALNGDGATLGFLGVIESYEGTKAANIAKYYAGIIYLRNGNYEQGLEYLEEYNKSETMVSGASYAAMGFAYEEMGDYQAAAAKYESAAYSPDKNEHTTPYYLMHAARNYELAGNSEGALKIYKDIEKYYPESEEGKVIDKYIYRITGPDGDA